MQCHMFICYLCSPPVDIKHHQIGGHLRYSHNTSTSTKCCKCDFIGAKNDIIEHYNKEHSGSGRHGIRQVAINFIRPKRDFVPYNRENSVSADTNGAKRPAQSAPISASSSSKQSSKASLQNKALPVRKVIAPVLKRPNLMSNLKKSKVVMGFTSWAQEASRNSITSDQVIQPRSLPSTSLSHAKSHEAKDGNKRANTVFLKSTSSHPIEYVSRKISEIIPTHKPPQNVRTYSRKQTLPTISRSVEEDESEIEQLIQPESEQQEEELVDIADSPEAEEETESEPGDESQAKSLIEPESTIFPYISSKNDSERGSSIYFCIFCDKTYKKFNLAFYHIRVHLKFGYHCDYGDNHFELTSAFMQHHVRRKHPDKPLAFKDDHIQRRNTNSWIIDFLNEQFLVSRFIDEDIVIEKPTSWIQCPVCVKAAKYKKKIPFKFTSFRTFERHYWQHTRWWRVDCVLCGASIQRAHQRDHLAEHEIHMQDADTNLEIFELYFQERIDEIASNKLDSIVDSKEKEFYARYSFYRGLKRELNVCLIPCDSDLSYFLAKKKAKALAKSTAKEKSSPRDNIRLSIDANKSETKVPDHKLSTESRDDDDLSSNNDIESEAALRLAMKILEGGVSPEYNSSIENEPPSNASDTQKTSTDDEDGNERRLQGITDKDKDPVDSEKPANDNINLDEGHSEGNKEHQHLADISANIQNKGQEDNSKSSESFSSCSVTNQVNNVSQCNLNTPQPSAVPISDQNVPNERVLLSPDSSLRQMLEEVQDVGNNLNDQLKVQNLLNSNVDDLIVGNSALDELLSGIPDQLSTEQTSTSIPCNHQQPSVPQKVQSDLKRTANSSGGPPSKIPKEKVEFYINQVLAKSKQGINSSININHYIVNPDLANKRALGINVPSLVNPNSVISPSPASLSYTSQPVSTHPNYTISFPSSSVTKPCSTLVNLLKSPVVPSTSVNQNTQKPQPTLNASQKHLNYSGSFVNPQTVNSSCTEEDDDICILEARIVKRQPLFQFNTTQVQPQTQTQTQPQPQPQPQPQTQTQTQTQPQSQLHIQPELLQSIKSFHIDQELFKQIVGPVDASMIARKDDGTITLKIPIEKIQQMARISTERRNTSLTDLSNTQSSNMFPVTIVPNSSTISNTYTQAPVIKPNTMHSSSCMRPPSSSVQYSRSSPVVNNQFNQAVRTSTWTPVPHLQQRATTLVNHMPHPYQNKIVPSIIQQTILPKPQVSQTGTPVLQSRQQIQSMIVQNHHKLLQQQQHQIQQQQRQQHQIHQQRSQQQQQQQPQWVIQQMMQPQGQARNLPIHSASHPLPSQRQLSNVHSDHVQRASNISPVVTGPDRDVPSPYLHLPSPPPPYHQHDKHSQHPMFTYSENTQSHQQPQQQCQQPIQYQEQPQQVTSQSQQALYQQSSLSVSQQISSMIDHNYTNEQPYHQQNNCHSVITSTQTINSNQSAPYEQHSDSIFNNQLQDFAPQNLPSSDFTSNTVNSNVQQNTTGPSQIPMAPNYLANYSHSGDWPIDDTTKTRLDGQDDIQSIANFGSATNSGPTYWTPKVFP